MTTSTARARVLAGGLILAAGIAAQACSSSTTGAGWTFGPTLAPSSGVPSALPTAAPPGASPPTQGSAGPSLPTQASPGGSSGNPPGSQGPVGTIGPATSSAPGPSVAPSEGATRGLEGQHDRPYPPRRRDGRRDRHPPRARHTK